MIAEELRQIDAQIAERVMNLRLLKHPLFDEPWVVSTHPGTVEEWDRFELPHYSTDIAAAIQVANTFHHYVIAKDRLGTRCSLVAHDRTYHTHTVRAETAPLAICQAALAAVRQ